MTAAQVRSFAEERRAEIRAKAAAIGIDEAYISRLVDCFYARVRTDETLGPIFEEAILDQWEPHLARMKAFWNSVALNAGEYSGRPVPVRVAAWTRTGARRSCWPRLASAAAARPDRPRT